MITSAQQKAIEGSIIGKPIYDTELCFYLKNDETMQNLINQICSRLTGLYGFALFETVQQLIPYTDKNGVVHSREENITRIRVLMTNAVWERNFVALSWIVHGIMNIFGLSNIDLSIDGIFYRAHI